MKMLIFGGSGRTGQVMQRAATAAGWEVQAPTHADCDLLNTQAVTAAVLESGAAAVVNCAAISGLEACLDDPLTAHLVNAVAPAAMALACRHTGARFVHLSTDYVLEGQRPGLKNESTRCKPANVYGLSKREGEQQVTEALESALILRVSWVCGNPAKPSFVESSLSKALAGAPLAAIADKYSLPTDATDIARVVLELLPRQVGGVLHVCSGGEPLSWYDCAMIVLQHAVALGALPQLPPMQQQLLAQATFFREVRPRHTAMSNERLLSLGIPMPTAVQTLQNVAERYLKNYHFGF
ncbi:MAG: NAD(P)-dependent oxidoreductase [Akkermansia sp.]|nr:NAD(P)-dependent oxidoreductase [Akkermansia sp.]